jgi:hypothetical protein
VSLGWRKLLPALLAAFALGAAAGAWAHRMGGRRHRMSPPSPQRMVAKIDRVVGLDDGQRRAVEGLLEARRPDAETLHRETFEKMEALRRSVSADIRALLRPDQQAKFDAMSERMEARRSRLRGRH